MNERTKTLFQATRAHKNTTHTHRTAENGKEKKNKMNTTHKTQYYKETI